MANSTEELERRIASLRDEIHRIESAPIALSEFSTKFVKPWIIERRTQCLQKLLNRIPCDSSSTPAEVFRGIDLEALRDPDELERDITMALKAAPYPSDALTERDRREKLAALRGELAKAEAVLVAIYAGEERTGASPNWSPLLSPASIVFSGRRFDRDRAVRIRADLSGVREQSRELHQKLRVINMEVKDAEQWLRHSNDPYPSHYVQQSPFTFWPRQRVEMRLSELQKQRTDLLAQDNSLSQRLERKSLVWSRIEAHCQEQNLSIE